MGDPNGRMGSEPIDDDDGSVSVGVGSGSGASVSGVVSAGSGGSGGVSTLNSGMLWLAAWFLLNMFLTMMNKALFQWYGFLFPIHVSMVHMLCSAVFAYLSMGYVTEEQRKLSSNEHFSMFLFSILFCLNVMVGNLGLRYANVSLVQVVRSCIPGITIVLSVLILGKSYTSPHYYAIFCVVIGVALATIGEIDPNVKGIAATVLVCFLSSLKSVVSNKFLVGNLKFHPFELLYRMALYAIFEMAFLGWVAGETANLSAWWQENGSVNFLLLLFVNGAMAFGVNLTNFMTTRKTSALTVTVAGNVKHIVTIVMSVLVFRNPISLLNAVGTVITIIGAVWYSHVEYNEKNVPRKRQPSHAV